MLLGGPEAGLSRRSAAEARALLPANTSLIHVTTPRDVGDRAHLRFYRERRDFEEVDGLPVTTVPQTLVDLAATCDRRRTVEQAVDAAAAGGVLDIAGLPERLPRLLRAVLEDHHVGSTITRGELEELFLVVVDGAGLRRPEFNVPLTLADGSAVVVDALWRRERIAVELQSWRHHRTRFEADHRKAALLELAGYTALRFTWRMLTHEERLVVRRLCAALSAR